jgi:hypothetical protein
VDSCPQHHQHQHQLLMRKKQNPTWSHSGQALLISPATPWRAPSEHCGGERAYAAGCAQFFSFLARFAQNLTSPRTRLPTTLSHFSPPPPSLQKETNHALPPPYYLRLLVQRGSLRRHERQRRRHPPSPRLMDVHRNQVKLQNLFHSDPPLPSRWWERGDWLGGLAFRLIFISDWVGFPIERLVDGNPLRHRRPR